LKVDNLCDFILRDVFINNKFYIFKPYKREKRRGPEEDQKRTRRGPEEDQKRTRRGPEENNVAKWTTLWVLKQGTSPLAQGTGYFLFE
jgi:hypothetical protein